MTIGLNSTSLGELKSISVRCVLLSVRQLPILSSRSVFGILLPHARSDVCSNLNPSP